MAIVKISKFSLLSFDNDRSELLKAFQQFNLVQFNKVDKNFDFLTEINNSESLIELDSKIEKVKWAINFLDENDKKNSFEKLKEGVSEYSFEEINSISEEFNFNDNYNKLFELNAKRKNYQNEIFRLKAERQDLLPWSSLKINISQLKDNKYIFFKIGSIENKELDKIEKKFNELNLTEFIKVSSNKKVTYIILAAYKDIEEKVKKVLFENNFNAIIINTDGIVSDKIENLVLDITENEEKIKLIDKDIKNLLYLKNNFKIYYEFLINNENKLKASELFLRTKKVNKIVGYIPTNKEEEFKELLNKVLNKNYYIYIKKADKEDPNVPILLKNNRFNSAFEQITAMYSLPKYSEVDPTPLLAPFYFISSGIMIGDAGYGLLVFLLCFFLPKIFKLSNKVNMFLRFIEYLSISSIFWGLIFGAFFGNLIPLPVIISPEKDYIKMISISMIFGVIQIFFGISVKGYELIRDNKYLDALFDVGFWMAILIGCIVMGLSKILTINIIFINISWYMIIIGALGIVLTSGRHNKTILGKLAWGLYSLYGISSYLGDLVSYFRLMALNLAGGFLAISINLIAKMLIDKGFIGAIAGVIIFIVFQLFGLFLTYLSAFVHTGRLTYVEMFNKFYEGGGKPFKKMISDSKYFNIKGE